MADETAQPVVSNEPVATPAGDTEGTAVAVAAEQPQQQTEGADAADETPVVELSEEHRKSWNNLPPDLRKQVNRLFTQKTQEFAAEKQKYSSAAELYRALELNPDVTVEMMARQRGFQVVRPQAAQPTPQEQAVKDENLTALEAQFGPEAAKAIMAVSEQIADKKAEARIKPLQDHHQQTQRQQEQADAASAVDALTKEFPDWRDHEQKMIQLAERLPKGDLTKTEYSRILYLAVNPGRTSAATTKAVIDQLNKSAKAAETPAQPVPNQRVASARPKGLSFDAAMKDAAQAASRGVLYED